MSESWQKTFARTGKWSDYDPPSTAEDSKPSSGPAQLMLSPEDIARAEEYRRLHPPGSGGVQTIQVKDPQTGRLVRVSIKDVVAAGKRTVEKVKESDPYKLIKGAKDLRKKPVEASLDIFRVLGVSEDILEKLPRIGKTVKGALEIAKLAEMLANNPSLGKMLAKSSVGKLVARFAGEIAGEILRPPVQLVKGLIPERVQEFVGKGQKIVEQGVGVMEKVAKFTGLKFPFDIARGFVAPHEAVGGIAGSALKRAWSEHRGDSALAELWDLIPVPQVDPSIFHPPKLYKTDPKRPSSPPSGISPSTVETYGIAQQKWARMTKAERQAVRRSRDVAVGRVDIPLPGQDRVVGDERLRLPKVEVPNIAGLTNAEILREVEKLLGPLGLKPERVDLRRPRVPMPIRPRPEPGPAGQKTTSLDFWYMEMSRIVLAGGVPFVPEPARPPAVDPEGQPGQEPWRPPVEVQPLASQATLFVGAPLPPPSQALEAMPGEQKEGFVRGPAGLERIVYPWEKPGFNWQAGFTIPFEGGIHPADKPGARARAEEALLQQKAFEVFHPPPLPQPGTPDLTPLTDLSQESPVPLGIAALVLLLLA